MSLLDKKDELSYSYDGAKTMVININSPLYNMSKNHLSFAYFVCLLGSKELIGKYWIINKKKSIHIGRSYACDIQIQETSISKKHLYISKNRNNNIVIKDLNSTNGTCINDELIEPKTEIEITDNSTIKLGNIVFKFLDKGNAEIISVIENFKRSFKDALTGIGNKLMLDIRGKELFEQSVNYKTDLSIIIFDIDFFKKVNDVYGHLAGDFILKEVVVVVKSFFRSEDLLVRCGGEEFCIIIKAPSKIAIKSIELARQKIQEHVFEYKKDKIKITISAGVTQKTKTDKDIKIMYERADEFLYKSKNSGRNKTSSQ